VPAHVFTPTRTRGSTIALTGAFGRDCFRSRTGLAADQGADQGSPPTGQQCRQNPTFFAVGVANASPIAELGEDLDGEMASNECPSQRVVDARPGADIGRLALDRDEAGYRKAAPIAELGAGRRAEQSSERDRRENCFGCHEVASGSLPHGVS
jgi:hypothetical protein